VKRVGAQIAILLAASPWPVEARRAGARRRALVEVAIREPRRVLGLYRMRFPAGCGSAC